MTKSFLTHFSTIVLVHSVALLGTWQMSQSDFIQDSFNKLGPGVIKLQVASQIITNPIPDSKKENKALLKTSPASTQKAEKNLETPQVQEQSVAGSTMGTSETGNADALSAYKAELRAIIDQNKYYPTMSRRLGQTGTVVVAFTLLHDGHIINVRIDKPSQYERLNLSALDAVKKVERFKPLPKEVREGKMDIKVPVKFVTI
jgi:TonB family protein